MELKDFLNSENIALYLKEIPQEKTIDRALFPVKKQMGTSIEYAKGAKKKAVALRMSTFDVAAKVRALSAELSVFKKEMPYFKEAMGINETVRRDLINAMSSNNQNLVDALVNQVFENYEVLNEGARIALKRMRTQLIQNGEINITTADGDIVIDYGVPTDHKLAVSAFTKAWTDASADIIGDIREKVQKKLVEGHYPKATVALMTEATFDKTFMVNTAIKGAILAGYKTNFPILGQSDYLEYIKKVCQLDIVFLENTTYYPAEGEDPVAYYEDAKITFMSGATLGNTVMGVTPEEFDKQYGSGKLDTTVVDNVAITTMVKEDPVSVDVKASTIGVPSFEKADEVIFATVYSA